MRCPFLSDDMYEDTPKNLLLEYLVIADWHEESGDPVIAAGLRWMSSNEVRPFKTSFDPAFIYMREKKDLSYSALPVKLWDDLAYDRLDDRAKHIAGLDRAVLECARRAGELIEKGLL